MMSFENIFLIILVSIVFFLIFLLVRKNQNTSLLYDNLQKDKHDILEQIKSHERAVNEMVHNRFDSLSERVHASLSASSDKTHDSLYKLKERISVLDVAQKKITELSVDVVTLQDILSNKQSRGAFGEIQLYDVVTTILPPHLYEFQKTLQNGKRVDCFLNLPNPPGPLAIDAKFPLESYRAMLQAKGEEKKIAARNFRKDVLKHVKDIQEKYILPEQTGDSALMFLPSEAIYAELHTDFLDVVENSFKLKIWIVSPTTLMATLNTIRAIVKDVQLKEQSKIIQAEIGNIKQEIQKFSIKVQKLKTHFNQCQDDIDYIEKSSEKIVKKARKIEDVHMNEL